MTLQQHLADNKSIKDLALNPNQKKQLINKIRDDDERKNRVSQWRASVVTKSKEQILDVMNSYHVNNGLYSKQAVQENLLMLRKELMPD